MSTIDWSKAGKRIRHQPKDPWGKSQDWNLTRQKWKDEADYYADELSIEDVIGFAVCPSCSADAGEPCRGLRGPLDYHTPRRREAGEIQLAVHGPRFS